MAPANTLTLRWPIQANAATYTVDVYHPPNGKIATVTVPASACIATECSAPVTVNGATGLFNVWIQARAGDVASTWAQSQFAAAFNLVTLSAPADTISPASNDILRWPRQTGVTSYFVDIYRPPTYVKDPRREVFASTCGPTECTLDVDLTGITGEVRVWIAPTNNYNYYGTWNKSIFTISGS